MLVGEMLKFHDCERSVELRCIQSLNPFSTSEKADLSSLNRRQGKQNGVSLDWLYNNHYLCTVSPFRTVLKKRLREKCLPSSVQGNLKLFKSTVRVPRSKSLQRTASDRKLSGHCLGSSYVIYMPLFSLVGVQLHPSSTAAHEKPSFVNGSSSGPHPLALL